MEVGESGNQEVIDRRVGIFFGRQLVHQLPDREEAGDVIEVGFAGAMCLDQVDVSERPMIIFLDYFATNVAKEIQTCQPFRFETPDTPGINIELA